MNSYISGAPNSMERLNFVFKINGEEKDLTKTIDVKELQICNFEIDPKEFISVELLINQEKITLYKIEKPDPPGYFFKSFDGYNFKEIGIYELVIRAGNQSFTKNVRAIPEKISTEDYKKILDDIRNETYNLVFSVFGKSSEDVRLARVAGKKSLIEFLTFFRRNFKLFKEVFERIERDPNRGLVKAEKISQIYETETFDDVVDFESSSTKSVFPIQQQLGFLPRRVSYQENHLSFDIYENRLLKHFLGYILNTLSFIELSIHNEIELQEERMFFNDTQKLQDLLKECQILKKDALNMWKKDFLDNVSPVGLIKTSMVLQREPKYLAFYRIYQEFRLNYLLEINSEYFSIPIRRAWQIYEIWVFLKIARVLEKAGFEPQNSLVDTSEGTNFKVKTSRFNFGLKENIPLFVYKQKDITAELYYQRNYPKLWSTESASFGCVLDSEKTPDVVIELRHSGDPTPNILILDAKYRLESSLQQALEEMSLYAHNIRDRNHNRLVKSAHIIYPGDQTKTFTSNLGFIGLLPTSNMIDFEKKVLDLFLDFIS